jgi:L-malate glycosyltransferase
MKKKIHFHTDCSFFAGCENMLSEFFSSCDLKDQFEVTLSYRFTELYTDGLKSRSMLDSNIYPLRLFDFSQFSLFPPSRLFWPFRRIERALLYLISPALVVYQFFALWRLFSVLKPDVLHLNNGGYPGALSVRVAAVAGKVAGISSILMVVNNLDVDYRRLLRWGQYPLDYLTAKCVNRFITGSEAASTKLQNVLDLPKRKLVAIHNGISLRPITETKTETKNRIGIDNFSGVVFGVVALMIPRKGHLYLIKAIVYLQERYPEVLKNIKILFEGSGPLRDELELYVRNNNLTENIIFVGSELNVMNFFAILDVFILPSIEFEDFPNVIIEAMGMGKPVISSRLAGTPEQVKDHQTGLLVEPKNEQQLALAILDLALDTPKRKSMSIEGTLAFNNKFRADIAIKNYIKLYQSIL